MIEKDLGNSSRLLEGGEVTSLRKRDRSAASKRSVVGVAFRWVRPVVLTVNECQRSAYQTVERSRGDHAVDVAVDLACDPRIASTTTSPAKLGEVVRGQLAPVEEAASQDDAQRGPVLLLRPAVCRCRASLRQNAATPVAPM